MKVETIIIKNCNDCRHRDHTGAFTKGGAKPCCNHPEIVEIKGYDCFKRVIPYRVMYPFETSKGFMRALIPRGIPKWCPLEEAEK